MAKSASQSRLVQIVKIAPEVSSSELQLSNTTMYHDSQHSHLTPFSPFRQGLIWKM